MRTLHVAMISEGQCRESMETFVANSHEELVALVAEDCRKCWRDTEIEGDPPEDNAACVDLYFKDGDLVLVWGEITPP